MTKITGKKRKELNAALRETFWYKKLECWLEMLKLELEVSKAMPEWVQDMLDVPHQKREIQRVMDILEDPESYFEPIEND